MKIGQDSLEIEYVMVPCWLQSSTRKQVYKFTITNPLRQIKEIIMVLISDGNMFEKNKNPICDCFQSN